MPSTIYDIQVKFRDKGGFDRTAKAASRASKRIGILERSIRSAGTALVAGGAFFAIKGAKNALIGFNVQLEQAQNTMGLLLKTNLGGTWAKNQERANILVKQFQEDAKKSVATTMDFVDMGSRITGPLTKAGATLKDINEITKGAVIATKAMGEEAGLVARDIEAALRGTLNIRDRFILQLLPGVKVAGKTLTKEMFNEMAKRSPAEARKILKKVFTTDAIKDAAEDQARTYLGVMSTLKDNFQRMFGRMGEPLVQAITAAGTRLNAWFDNNATKVEQLVTNVGDALVKAFGFVSKTFELIAENKDVLFALAKAVLITKGAGLVGGLFGRGMGGFSKLSKFASTVGGASVSFRALSGNIGPVSTALGLFAAALQTGADAINKQRDEELKRTSKGTGVSHVFSRFGKDKPTEDMLRSSKFPFGKRQTDIAEAKGLVKVALKEGFAQYGDNPFLDPIESTVKGVLGQFDLSGLPKERQEYLHAAKSTTALISRIGEMEKFSKFNLHKLGRMGLLEAGAGPTLFNEKTLTFATTTGQRVIEFIKNLNHVLSLVPFVGDGRFLEPEEGKRKNTGKPQVDVTINRIEIASDDPDRFAFNLVSSFNDMARNPVQAANTIPGR